jgi:pimeloyl-ACP methyl ester carboxylesterase
LICRHRIASDRAVLSVEVVGNGDPVVFLHARVADSRMWRAQLDAIGANKAIAYDRRGPRRRAPAESGAAAGHYSPA